MLDGFEVIKVWENHEKESDSDFISVFHHQHVKPWLHDNLVYETSKNNCAFTALEDNLFLPRRCYKEDDGVLVIFESGCTHAVTSFVSDFIGKITPLNKLMNGLGATTSVLGEGNVLWSFRDDFEVLNKLRVNAYHVPASKVRLFSLKFDFQQDAGNTCLRNADGTVFAFVIEGGLCFKYSGPLVPIAHASIQIQTSSAGYLASTGRKNISKAQEELLLWHATLGHYNITNM